MAQRADGDIAGVSFWSAWARRSSDGTPTNRRHTRVPTFSIFMSLLRIDSDFLRPLLKDTLIYRLRRYRSIVQQNLLADRNELFIVELNDISDLQGHDEYISDFNMI